MKKIFLYSRVDAPPPPPEFFQYYENKVREVGVATVQAMLERNSFRLPGDTRGPEITERKLKLNGTEQMHAFNNTMFFNEDMVKWAHKNISPTAKDFRFNHTTPGRARLGPHVDATRKYPLIWLVKPGGPDHRTVFYRQKSTGIIMGPANYVVNDYDDLEEIGSVSLPTNSGWMLLSGLVIHSVENIIQGRFALQISFNDMPDLELKNPVYHVL